ncbi:mitochondrial uncoupling 3 [Micractinium conductrix]|uniref:Mitochondrial uncoupling 3 n=1 Tax=Micractinium conductrix TaxID=554055 RepID=A0A2P6VF76_9CHLO|nr:mitochondrial uncoupling 3 [Micractinium conductrix]|eukprot:PSC72740.1 mitochondrial uncoupling 3 [Micractinium conductrix]
MPSPADPTAAAAQKLALSALAASVAETATFPLDLLKTRLQLQGQALTAAAAAQQQAAAAAAQQQAGAAAAAAARAAARPGLAAVALSVVHTEGFMGLYAGLAPAVLRHVPYTGIRVLAFEQLRGLAQRTLGTQPGAPLPLPAGLAAGLVAGGLGQLVAVPADLVKVRMQADGRAVAAGLAGAPRYRGVLHAFRTIAAHQGLPGLWRGSLPAVQRAALVNLGELSTYDAAKRAVLRSGVTGGDNAWAHAASSVCSGFCASVVSTPADVVKTRLMAQDPAVPTYRGMLHCFTATLRAEGLRGLYAGFLPTWARLGPWQLTFWLSFEQLRKAAGLGGF